MHLNSFLQISGLIVLSFAVAFSVLWILAVVQSRSSNLRRGFMIEKNQKTAFLFEDDRLVDATSDARQILDSAAPDQSDWNQLISVYSPKFPELTDALGNLAETCTIHLKSGDGTACLNAEWRDGLAYIWVEDDADNQHSAKLDSLTLAAMEREIETLRATTQAAPFLVWRQQADGTIIWANNTYLELASQCDPDAHTPSWPPHRLFDSTRFEEESQSSQARLTLHVPGEPNPRWFDCLQTCIGEDRLFTAVSADSLVNAEVALRDFIQTLTKTFAHLTTGLAIFDKQRRLSLFNPALSDLTSLSPAFLTARPTLHSVLDCLREKHIIPEPKDYKSWRQKMHDLEAAAIEGTYEETWSLASGQTFRVVGRPHPDGAVAFIFEDISAEISLTRRYRSELESGQAVIDSFDEAIAVFSADGSLTLSNTAYAQLWGTDPSCTLANHCIAEAVGVWSEGCAPTPVWRELREFVGTFGNRSTWSTEVQSRNGQALVCRISPLSGGSTLIGFTPGTVKKEAVVARTELQPRVGDGSLAI